ncbi:MAG: hypothetical protein CTY19_08840 [Methylomonas sp.]|jgi:Ni/Co efflux regulator RcnB|nr:MAG: hypothetical protein CTY19_08840 [Methylomonas sp.]
MALLHIRSCNSSEPQYSQYIKIFSKIAVSLSSLAFVDGCMWRLNVIVLLTLVWVSVSVKAERPDNVGNEKHKQHAKHEKLSKKHTHEVDEHTSSQSKSDYQSYFNEQHRSVIREFYANEIRRGDCPPGLAKKQNGCLPPGQAKRWKLGQILPRDVRYHHLPDSVIGQMGYPPAGYRFVRVDSDILMLSVGTGLVVDAMSNLLGSP